ncbi:MULTISPECIES: amino acid ABC transporter permease [Paenibacillus]|uniref:Cysteine ABC transporter permease n=1 Tax=Paenibacillus naphthalenovorans TaxID=162209 RepID=A0A0U2VUN7_9BACL|nr:MULTISPECIES: amino acid ABC transporter permease [Paenibacillus]ALS24422.1 cysteine ABC transporter permease [Paenibacillus naphthalenovorans]
MTFDVDFFIKTFFVCLKAVPVALEITAVTLMISLPVGFCFAFLRIKSGFAINGLITAYISLVRGTPIVVQILVLYSMLPSILASLLKGINSPINVYDVDPIYYAYVIFSLNTTAILSEVFRSALSTVPKGQLEAAESAGLTTFQAYRRIIIPQAMVTAVPNICTATINLIKATSLAFLMTVKEITAVAKIEAAYGYNYIEAYLDIWIIYFLVCIIVERMFKMLETRLKIYKSAA